MKPRKGVSFRIEEDLNKRFHIKCVKEGWVMGKVVTRLIQAWVDGDVEL